MSKKREPYEIFSVQVGDSYPPSWQECTELTVAPAADIIQFLDVDGKPVIVRTKETVVITYLAAPPSSDIITPPGLIVPQH